MDSSLKKARDKDKDNPDNLDEKRLPADSVSDADPKIAEKLTGEDDVYDPEGLDG